MTNPVAASREIALRERDVALDRITALESEVAQLREDMEWIAERCSALIGLTGANEYAASSIESRTRAALGRKT